MKNMRKNTDEKLSFFKWISFFSDLSLTNTIYFVETVLRFFYKWVLMWRTRPVQFCKSFLKLIPRFFTVFFSLAFFSLSKKKNCPFNSFVIVDAFSPSVHRTQIVIANTIGILLCFRCMHLFECRKCNKVSLHATYRLTFVGNVYIFFPHRILLGDFFLLLYISTVFFFVCHIFCRDSLPLFCLIFSYSLKFFFILNKVCVNNVYIFLIWFFFGSYMSPIIWTWIFFIWHSIFYGVFCVCAKRLLIYMNFKNFIQFYNPMDYSRFTELTTDRF